MSPIQAEKVENIGMTKLSVNACRNSRRLWRMHSQNISFVSIMSINTIHTHTHTHTRLTAPCPGLPRWAGTRKVKPIWILLKQETVSGSGISWAICKSAPRSRQITTPAPHHSVFYRPDALPAAQPTASEHWRLQTQYTGWNDVTESMVTICSPLCG